MLSIPPESYDCFGETGRMAQGQPNVQLPLFAAGGGDHSAETMNSQAQWAMPDSPL